MFGLISSGGRESRPHLAKHLNRARERGWGLK